MTEWLAKRRSMERRLFCSGIGVRQLGGGGFVIMQRQSLLLRSADAELLKEHTSPDLG